MSTYKILSCVDFSEISQHAYLESLKVARKADAELHLIHVHADKSKAASEVEKQFLDFIDSAGSAKDGLIVTHTIVDGEIGDLAELIGEYADNLPANLIVSGYEVKKGMKRFIGPNVTKIISHTHVGVITIRMDQTIENLDSIMFPIALGEYALQKKNHVAHLAEALDLTVHIVPLWIPGKYDNSGKAKLKVFARQVSERMIEHEVATVMNWMEGDNEIELVEEYTKNNEIGLISKVFDDDETPLDILIGTKDEKVLETVTRPVYYVRSKPETIDRYKEQGE